MKPTAVLVGVLRELVADYGESAVNDSIRGFAIECTKGSSGSACIAILATSNVASLPVLVVAAMVINPVLRYAYLDTRDQKHPQEVNQIIR